MFWLENALKHSNADLSNVKDTLALIQDMVVA